MRATSKICTVAPACHAGVDEAMPLRLFSLAQRHRLLREGYTVRLFDAEPTDLQRQILALIGVPASAYRAST